MREKGSGTRHEAQEMRDEGKGKWHKARSTRDGLANQRLEGNYYIIKNTSLYDLVISAFLLLQ
jgi:hypothetical protein